MGRCARGADQEAFAIAAERWPLDGSPANPRAWLVTTARNRAIDRVRRDHTLVAKAALLRVQGPVQEAANDTMDATTFPDERLELVFTCCHPALAIDAQAELLRRLDRTEEARDAYRRALPLVHDDAERRLFERRLAELDSCGPRRSMT